MSAFVDKLRAGETPTDSDWTNHLLAAHREAPGLTPAAFSNLRTRDGHNSYSILAQTVSEGADVLDLACGDGHLVPYILERIGANGTVTALDMSVEELLRARGSTQDPRVQFVEGHAQSLPFTDQSFDHVVCHLALMLMVPLEPVAREVARVLKPGGTFSSVIAARPDDDFLIALNRICLKFVDASLPGRAAARTGDNRLGTIDGLKYLFSQELGFDSLESIRSLHFETTTTPEGIWSLMKGMYFVGMLTPQEKEQLRIQVGEHTRSLAKFGRHIHFEFPMKMFSFRHS